jgi:hypothetical protein
MRTLPQENHADLGIVPGSDYTEDLRRTKNAPGERCRAAEGEEPINHQTDDKKGSTTMIPQLVDIPLPPGADPDLLDGWEPPYEGAPAYRVVWSKKFHDDADVRVAIVQYGDGQIVTEGNDGPLVYVGDDNYPPGDARRIAEALTAAADLADRWVGIPEPAPAVLSPVQLLASAYAELRAAYSQLSTMAGPADDFVQAALDAISEAAEVLR